VSGVVGVLDYGLGNLHSVVKAFEHEGAEVLLSGDPDALQACERWVLPGVGAFGAGMDGLRRQGLVEALRAAAKGGRPILGICLGMQLFFDESDEFGLHQGLGLIPGRVEAIPKQEGLKLPHMGWNRLRPPSPDRWTDSVLGDITPGDMMYFVHSLAAVPSDPAHRLAEVCYGAERIVAAVQRGAVVGCQFHPEKSGPVGLSIIRRFLTLPPDEA